MHLRDKLLCNPISKLKKDSESSMTWLKLQRELGRVISSDGGSTSLFPKMRPKFTRQRGGSVTGHQAQLSWRANIPWLDLPW